MYRQSIIYVLLCHYTRSRYLYSSHVQNDLFKCAYKLCGHHIYILYFQKMLYNIHFDHPYLILQVQSYFRVIRKHRFLSFVHFQHSISSIIKQLMYWFYNYMHIMSVCVYIVSKMSLSVQHIFNYFILKSKYDGNREKIDFISQQLPYSCDYQNPITLIQIYK